MTTFYKNNILDLIPKLFSLDIKNEEYSEIFNFIKTVLDYKYYYLFFLNSEDIQIKSTNNNNFSINETIELPEHLSSDLFVNNTEIINNNHPLIKLLGLKNSSYLISKLNIKGAVFGFILLEKDNVYNSEDSQKAQAFSSILSYKIKDLELSNVFKIQTKALKSAVEDTHEAYHTIKLQNKKILAADKIKNEFLASVSHELRTPLNAIIGYSDILKTGSYGKLNEKQEDYINEIQIAGVQLLGMVNEILDITKIEANAIKLVKRYFEISRPIIETKNLLLPLIKNKDLNIIINIRLLNSLFHVPHCFFKTF